MWRLDGPCKMFHVEHFDTFSDGQGRAPRQTVPFDRPGNRTPGTRWETLPGINSRNPHPQAAACGSVPPHKSGRPGDRFSCDARGTTRRPVISSCRRQFSADPQLAPGFLKGPAGPLSRAPRGGTAQAKQRNKGCAATAKHLKIAPALQMQGGGAMAVFVTAERRQRSRCCGGVRFCGFVDLLSGAHQGRVFPPLFDRAKSGSLSTGNVHPKRRTQNHATGYQIKISNKPGLKITALLPKSTPTIKR